MKGPVLTRHYRYVPEDEVEDGHDGGEPVGGVGRVLAGVVVLGREPHGEDHYVEDDAQHVQDHGQENCNQCRSK